MRLIRIDDIAMESNFDVFKLILEKNGSVKGICIKNGADLSRAEIDRYIEFVKSFGLSGLAWMKCQNAELTTGIAKFFSPDLQNTLISRFDAKDGDLLLFGAEKEPLLNQSLDHLRRRIAKERNLIDENIIHCHWVHEFPLFEWKEEENRIISVTHPFTSPDPRDIHLLDTDPLKVRSLAYDLIINGYEVGGGSQRIFTKEMQEKIYKIMGLTQEEITNMFGFFSEALEYGTPPHLGAAFGLDRLLMILCKTENIRDVIAFPKTQKGTDLMTHSPSSVSSQHLKELSLGLKM
jgi:aspartyl-tRNA synthetase